jgi:FkbM family methyltransferase
MIPRRVQEIVERLGPLGRLVNRLSLWRRIRRQLRPTSLAGHLGLAGSAMLDSLRFCVAASRAVSPRTCCSLLLYAPGLDARFLVRSGADDIYNVLPFREMDVHDAILGNLRPGDIFVDGGANVGYYSILAAKAVGPGGMVVAIEAIPPTADQLAQNLELNGIANALIVQKAIQDDPHGRPVEIGVRQGYFGLASSVVENEVESHCRVRVEATTIDRICEHYSRVRLIKLDVEGAELAALQGAKKTLAKTDYVVVECNESQEAICQLLSDAGFSTRKLSFSTYVLGYRT